jgi:hypothetical protein
LHVSQATYSLFDVTKRSLPRWSLALLLVVATSASYGAAMQSTAELQALSCCTHDCGHQKAADPNRCCGVASPHANAATIAPTPPSPAPALVVVLLATPASPADEPTLAAASPDLAAARAAPVFLLTRSLRI